MQRKQPHQSIQTAKAFAEASPFVAGLKGLPNAPVSKYLSYLWLMVEAEALPAVPSEWSKDLTHVTPGAIKAPAAKQACSRTQQERGNRAIPL